MSVTTIREDRAVPAFRFGQPEPVRASDANDQRSPAVGESASAMAVVGSLVQSLLLEPLVRDAFGGSTAATDRLKDALDVAEREIHTMLAGIENSPPVGEGDSLGDPLTESEARVLRYLSTNLSKREIANELYVSVNTVKTHVKHLYAKLDVQSRQQAVERARALGLLSRRSRPMHGVRLRLVA